MALLAVVCACPQASAKGDESEKLTATAIAQVLFPLLVSIAPLWLFLVSKIRRNTGSNLLVKE